IQEEMNFVSKSINYLHEEKKVSYEDIAILYRVKNTYSLSYIDEIKKSLIQHDLPFTWITESSESKRQFIRNEKSIKISTIDSAKGLDFRAVFIVNIENMPFALEE